jgi:GNAT superfamily N-acetyltransferase
VKFRLAEYQDLAQLKKMYEQIIKNMNENGIKIWDDIYPCEFFEDDIKSKRLYILIDNQEIISAFALCDENRGEKLVKWEDGNAKSLYLDRFAVNVNYSKKGIASLMINKAKQVATNLGAEYLRLFVVDINKPAIQLYEKNHFKRAIGVYNEVFDDGFELREFGYEIKL